MRPRLARSKVLGVGSLLVLVGTAAAMIAPGVEASSAVCSITQEPPWAPVGMSSTNTGDQSVAFNSVSSASMTDAWAVGSSSSFPPLVGNAVAYHWTGARWKPVPVNAPENSVLFGVSDLGRGNAWAVGEGPWGVGLIEHWNGKTWQAVPTPASQGVFQSVSAVSADDVWAATGPSVEHWDGSSWSVLSPPIAGGLIEALGHKNVYVTHRHGIAHFDGATWQPFASRTVRTFDASMSSNIWVEPYTGGDPPVLKRWDGHTSTVIPMSASFVNGVSSLTTLSPSDTWALDGYNPAGGGPVIGSHIGHWNGSSWQIPDLSSVTPVFSNRRVQAIGSIPGSDSVWLAGSSGGNPLRPMFLLAHC